MASFQTVLLLLLAATVLALVARRFRLPVPVVMVAGGLGVALIPGLHVVAFDPDLSFAIFVPPLLFRAAITTSVRTLRKNLRAVLLLAVGLVGATMLTVAVATHRLLPDLGWPAAFVLGAILSPPDAVVGISLARSLGLSRRAIAIVEGETLLNDAAAFVLYRQAVHAATTHSFSIAVAIPQFFLVVAIGVAVGYAVTRLVQLGRKHLRDPVLETVVWLLVPFVAFVPAEAMGGSGVLAVVVAGLLLRSTAPLNVAAQTRVQSNAVYDVVEFVLNSLVFVLIGLEMGAIVHDPEGPPLGVLVRCSLVIAGVITLTRILWIFPNAYFPRLLSARIRRVETAPPVRGVAVLSWMGVRGGDSLVTALAIPLVVGGGAPFPGRALLVGITFGVILTTLVGQGLTLGPLITLLKMPRDDSAADEDALAREAMHAAASQRLDELDVARDAHRPALAHARLQHVARSNHRRAVAAGDEAMLDASRSIEHELLATQRATVVRLRNEGKIDDSTLRRIERDLDLEELRWSPPRDE